MVSSVVKGEKSISSKDQSDFELVCDIISQMLNAGYHQLLNKRKIDDWIIHFTDPLLSEYIEVYNVTTSAPDKTITDEFLENSQFRKVFLDMLINTSATYAYKNKLKINDYVKGKYSYIADL